MQKCETEKAQLNQTKKLRVHHIYRELPLPKKTVRSPPPQNRKTYTPSLIHRVGSIRPVMALRQANNALWTMLAMVKLSDASEQDYFATWSKKLRWKAGIVEFGELGGVLNML